MWLFSKRTQNNGQMDWWGIHDLDRDGLIDNNYGPSAFTDVAWADGLIEMSDNPIPLTPPATAALDPYAIGPDWLELLVDASDPYACAGTTANRGTEYDWARFFWKMTQTAYGDIAPDALADLYVDMCPTNWDSNETNSSADPPIDRLEASAIHQGATAQAAWAAYKHYGQDH